MSEVEPNGPQSSLGITPESDPQFFARVERLLRDGKTIEAIKVYRERTGLGLKESKDAIDQWRAQLGLATKSRSGCAGVIVLTIGIGLALAAARAHCSIA